MLISLALFPQSQQIPWLDTRLTHNSIIDGQPKEDITGTVFWGSKLFGYGMQARRGLAFAAELTLRLFPDLTEWSWVKRKLLVAV